MPGTDSPQLMFNGPTEAATTIILAHGAGAGMDTSFMEFFAQGLAAGGLRVVRFEFPYMAQRRLGGSKRPPDREDVLRQVWLDVIRRSRETRLVIGGKSLGGRIASLIADEAQVAGLVCLGYPFHPVGKAAQTRIGHLRAIKTPTLILQGTRDPFGMQEEVTSYPLAGSIRLYWLEDGEHSFKPRNASGRTETQNWEDAVAVLLTFIASESACPGFHPGSQ
ncbi:MAG: alpha/beta fold hydrolase [Thermoguttaceae bacterium]